MNITMELNGMDRVAAKLGRLAPACKQELDQARTRIGETAIRGIRADYCPKKYGALERSLTYRVEPDGSIWLMVPGNTEAAPYARRWHENEANWGTGTLAKVSGGSEYIVRYLRDNKEAIKRLIKAGFVTAGKAAR